MANRGYDVVVDVDSEVDRSVLSPSGIARLTVLRVISDIPTCKTTT